MFRQVIPDNGLRLRATWCGWKLSVLDHGGCVKCDYLPSYGSYSSSPRRHPRHIVLSLSCLIVPPHSNHSSVFVHNNTRTSTISPLSASIVRADGQSGQLVMGTLHRTTIFFLVVFDTQLFFTREACAASGLMFVD